LPVRGLEWASSGDRLETELLGVRGVLRATVNLASGAARVELLPELADADSLAEAVRRAGYDLDEAVAIADPVEREQAARAREYGELVRRFVFAAVVAVASMILSMPLMMEPSAMAGVDLLDRLMMPLVHGTLAVFPFLGSVSATALRWVL